MKKYKFLACFAAAFLFLYHITYDYRMENRVRSNVVQLFGENKGSCSGIHVKSNNSTYILTAGHCRILEDQKGEILVKDDKMSEPIPRRVLQEDKYSDLLLLEALPKHDGIELANKIEPRDKLISLTHGLGFATHRTEGQFIQLSMVDIINYIISNDEDEAACNMPKQKVEELQMFIFNFKICALHIEEMVSTMFISPGSSGGAVINSRGQLVGIASATGSGYSFSVPLKQIKEFLANW